MASPTKSRKRKQTTETPSSPEGRLATYQAKRRFEITPEPPSEEPKSPAATSSSEDAKRSLQSDGSQGKKTTSPAATSEALGLAFVVQKHDARRLHYDVRLEIEGAMASWAVPKGPSFDPAVRRLAVQTEDHPMAYNRFEGRIPDGEYGGGDVLIWDRGRYETVPPGQERAMADKGHLHVRLFGEKLVGEWHLVKTSRKGGDDGAGGSGKAQWLMFKAKDGFANPALDIVAERPESVMSGDVATRGPRRVGASEQGTSAATLLAAVGEPSLATAVDTLPNDGRWLFEAKYDGYRLFACKAGAEVRLQTRRSHDWTSRFVPIAEAMTKLAARECVIDGEVCVVDEQGRPSFSALQEWLSGGKSPARLAYPMFDLLWLDGRDLRREPIEVRRELLEKLVAGHGAPLSLSRAVEGDVTALLQAAKEGGLEGLVAKRKGSPYVAGRAGYWQKKRFDKRQDCAVIGWLGLAGAPEQMGALALAVASEGKLVYSGRVGSGFDAEDHRNFVGLLGAEIEAAAAAGVPRIKDAHWVNPALVVECVFTEWTREGSMRHPRFLRVREDKAPLDCVREEPSADVAADAQSPEEPAPPTAPKKPGKSEKPTLANPTKVLFPRDALTKRDVWDYYASVAPLLLPHLDGRPLTLQRYPDGIDGQEWYQQNAPEKTPSYVRLVEVGEHHSNKKRIVCDSVESLQWLANLAALTLHQWVSHCPLEATSRSAIDRALSSPDYVVLDLDPGDGPWSHLVEVAFAVRRLLDALKLESFPKTSGKRGVHIVVPVRPGTTHPQAMGFAEQVARAVAKVLPHVATVERMKDKRGGKLYVDYGQNGEGKTIVSPYTIRARDGAVVSTPIEWDELTESLDPTQFTIRTVLRRLDKRGDLFAGVLRGTQALPAV